MYNSSIKGQGKKIAYSTFKEIPHHIFYNDMSKNYICDDFRGCDCIYSDIAWVYGYKIFNACANNTPKEYPYYCNNINKLIEELEIPSFIVAGKSVKKYFPNAKTYNIKLNNSGTNMPNVMVYVWNYDYDENISSTKDLIDSIKNKFKKPLDFSCGYGEHLFKFEDFVACDIDKNCLTYLSFLYEARETLNGKT